MPETDLEIREGGEQSPKKIFQSFGSQFGLKIGGCPGPLGPSPRSATANASCWTAVVLLIIVERKAKLH